MMKKPDEIARLFYDVPHSPVEKKEPPPDLGRGGEAALIRRR